MARPRNEGAANGWRRRDDSSGEPELEGGEAPGAGARLLDEELQTYDRYLIHRDAVTGETEGPALALVGKGYEPLQNVDAFAFFEPFIDNKWATFETAGALGNGERVWVLARLAGGIIVAKDDMVDRFLLLSNTHDGSGAVTVRFTPIRVVCQNTLNLAKKGGKGIVSVKHTKNMVTHLAKTQLMELRRVVAKTFSEAETLFGHMALLKLQASDTDQFLNLLFPRTPQQEAKGEKPERWKRIEAILDDNKVTPTKTRNTLSLSISRVDPLPHQLEAVYDYFMRLPRIRFLLADDPGAGKTIMAGLLLKELKIRGRPWKSSPGTCVWRKPAARLFRSRNIWSRSGPPSRRKRSP